MKPWPDPRDSHFKVTWIGFAIAFALTALSVASALYGIYGWFIS